MYPDNLDDFDEIDAAIPNGFARTLVPFFTWCVSQFSSAILGCSFILVLRQPSATFKHQIMASWGRSDLFSALEIADFDRPSVRRRCRKRLQKLINPMYRELRHSPECLRLRDRFRKELIRLAQESDQWFEMPKKIMFTINITEIEEARSREIASYSTKDITDTFPLTKIVKPALVKQVNSDVGDYEETIRGLWWEASFNQGLLQSTGISNRSKAWKILGINPEKEPDTNQFIDLAFDMAFNKIDEDKIIGLARWIMGRMLLPETVEQPYSSKVVLRFDVITKSDTDERDRVMLEEIVADPTSAEIIINLEDQDILDRTLPLLSPAERLAIQLLCKTNSHHTLHGQLGKTGHETALRNFERAIERIRKLKESGELDI
jgi:hypothetical protein